MSACVMEEGREDGGGARADEDAPPERTRREVLLGGRGRRACSEQGPHPSLHPQHSIATAHLWGQGSGGRRGWSRKRTSAPQMSNPHGSMPRVALVLRSRRSWPVAPQSYRSTVVGGGVFRCCVPWCGARAAVPVDDADYALRGESPPTPLEEYVAPEPVISSPRPLGQQSPLPGIEEEDDSDWPLEDATDATLTPSYKSTRSSTDTAYTSSRSSGKKRFGSTSSVKICISAAARKSGKSRKLGGAVGSVSPSASPAQQGDEAPAPHGRMQAEQGSIGELQKYHGRYLKSRRHTLANVRRTENILGIWIEDPYTPQLCRQPFVQRPVPGGKPLGAYAHGRRKSSESFMCPEEIAK